jgi:hypothetical protein
VNLAPFVQQASTIDALLNYIGSIFLHGGMSANLYKQAYNAASAQSTPTAKAQAALYVALTSGEYQIIQ